MQLYFGTSIRLHTRPCTRILETQPTSSIKKFSQCLILDEVSAVILEPGVCLFIGDLDASKQYDRHFVERPGGYHAPTTTADVDIRFPQSSLSA